MAKKFLSLTTILFLTMMFAACGNSSPDPAAVSTGTEKPTPVGDSASTSRAPVSAAQIEESDLECLSSELGEEVDIFTLRRAQLGGAQPEQAVAALTECGVDPNALNVAGQFRNPEIQDCIAGVLGQGDSSLPRIQPGSTFGPSPELAAALEECGVESGDLMLGNPADRGGFRGFGAFGGGPLANPEVRECIAESLGAEPEEATGGFFGGIPGSNEDVAAALEECGGDFGRFPGLPSFDGITPSDPKDLGISPTAETSDQFLTPVQVSELSIEQLSCLSAQLDPVALGLVVVATSNGDISELDGDALVALIECGVEQP